ncbi:hypothetical protein H4I96_04806 [Botrytis cinerea]
MREVIVHPSPEIWTEITEVEIPQPGPHDVVIKVVVAGSNVKVEMISLGLFIPSAHMCKQRTNILSENVWLPFIR